MKNHPALRRLAKVTVDVNVGEGVAGKDGAAVSWSVTPDFHAQTKDRWCWPALTHVKGYMHKNINKWYSSGEMVEKSVLVNKKQEYLDEGEKREKKN